MHHNFGKNQQVLVSDLCQFSYRNVYALYVLLAVLTELSNIYFSYGASCVECQRLHAVWEGVGATLKGRVNVARVDSNLAGAATAKRFKVTKLPTFLL